MNGKKIASENLLKQIIKDAKRAGNLAKCGWNNESDFIEVDLALLERLAKYARLLALDMRPKK